MESDKSRIAIIDSRDLPRNQSPQFTVAPHADWHLKCFLIKGSCFDGPEILDVGLFAESIQTRTGRPTSPPQNVALTVRVMESKRRLLIVPVTHKCHREFPDWH